MSGSIQSSDLIESSNFIHKIDKTCSNYCSNGYVEGNENDVSP